MDTIGIYGGVGGVATVDTVAFYQRLEGLLQKMPGICLFSNRGWRLKGANREYHGFVTGGSGAIGDTIGL